MPEKHTDSLLSELQRAVKCYYLSDLHNCCHLLTKQMAAAIEAIPPERYSLEEWDSAVAYITKEQHHFQTAEEAKKRIIEG